MRKTPWMNKAVAAAAATVSLFRSLGRLAFHGRTRMAMVMAFVATLGAVTAYRATQDEMDASTCGRKLDEEQMIALVKRQEYLDTGAQGYRWADAYKLHRGRGQIFLQQAKSMRRNPEVDPSPLEIQAKVEFAIARQILPLWDANYVNLEGGIEQVLARRVTAYLREFGFGDHCAGTQRTAAATSSATVDYTTSLKQDIHTIENRAVNGAIAVVVFVAALVCFTLAEVFKRNSLASKRLEGLGVIVAVLAVGVALWADYALWAYFLLAAVLFAGVGMVVWTLVARLGTTPESAHETHQAADLHLDHVRWHVHFAPAHHPFGAGLMVGIALVALCSAFSTWGYGDAVTQAGRATAEAIDHQVAMFKESTRLRADTYAALDLLALLHERRTRTRVARQVLELNRAGIVRVTDPLFWAWEGDHWDRVLDKLFSTKDSANQWLQLLEGPRGPDEDAYFPERASIIAIRRPAEQLALWDSADGVSLVWKQRASLFLASLTLFAITLYLFGQSLGMGRTRSAYILAIFGCILLLAGVGQGIQALRQQPSAPAKTAVPDSCRLPGKPSIDKNSQAEVAAACYARGQELEWTAHIGKDYGDAAEAYQAAVNARPDFALARYRLAIARQFALTPQSPEDVVSLMGKRENLVNVVADREQAIRDWTQRGLTVPASKRGGLAFNRYMLALAGADRAGLKRSIADTEHVLRLDLTLLFVRYNLGVAYLADRQIDRGLRVYADAVRATVPNRDYDVVIGSITDLEVLRATCPTLVRPGWYSDGDCRDLNTRIDGLKGDLVRAVWPSPKGSVGVPQSLTARVSLDGVGWHAHDGFAGPRGTNVLAVMWFRQDPESGTWYALPRLSYQVDPSDLDSDGHQGWEHFKAYLSDSRYQKCLQAGRYRVEFYLNGKLAVQKPVEAPTFPERFQSAPLRDLGLAMCYPSREAGGTNGWSRWRPSDGADPGMVGGYASPDNVRGALLFSYFTPPVAGGASSEEVRKFAQEAVEFLRKHRIVRGSSKLADVGCNQYWDNWSAPHFQYVFDGEPPTTVLGKAWRRSDGLVHVGLVWRRLDAYSEQPRGDDLSCLVMTSITSIDPRASSSK